MILQTLQAFEESLRQREKAPATVEKYLRDAGAFLRWLDGRVLTRESVITYKEQLATDHAARSVNAMLAGVNAYLDFAGRPECRVKPLHIQRQIFADEGRELTKQEYDRLVRAARGTKIGYIM